MKYILATLLTALLISLGLLVATASAQSFRSGDVTTLAAGDKTAGSLWVSGRTVDIAGEVNGDLFCAGQNVTISGTVRGDVLCLAQTVVITGTVVGDVRSIAQSVTVNGIVAHSLSVASQSFTQGTKGVIRTDASVAANAVLLDGSVGRDVAVAGNAVTLAGPVGGEVVANVGNLRVASTAVIEGKVHYTSRNDAAVASGAKVKGGMAKTFPSQPAKPRHHVLGVAVWPALYVVITGLVVALVALWLFPAPIHTAARTALASPWRTLLVGFIALVAALPVVVFLMLTIIGIPLALLLLLAWLLVQAFGSIAAAYYTGRLLWRKQRNDFAIMVAGALVLLILLIVPLVGALVAAYAALMGTGMTLLALYRNRARPRESA